MKNETADAVRWHIREAILAECQGDDARGALERAVEGILNLIEGRVLDTILNWRNEDWHWHLEQFPELAARIQGQLPKAPICQTMQRPKAECGCPDCGSSLIDWPGTENSYHAHEFAKAQAKPAPAQTEQQPVMFANAKELAERNESPCCDWSATDYCTVPLYAAPIAQTEQEPWAYGWESRDKTRAQVDRTPHGGTWFPLYRQPVQITRSKGDT